MRPTSYTMIIMLIIIRLAFMIVSIIDVYFVPYVGDLSLNMSKFFIFC